MQSLQGSKEQENPPIIVLKLSIVDTGEQVPISSNKYALIKSMIMHVKDKNLELSKLKTRYMKGDGKYEEENLAIHIKLSVTPSLGPRMILFKICITPLLAPSVRNMSSGSLSNKITRYQLYNQLLRTSNQSR